MQSLQEVGFVLLLGACSFFVPLQIRKIPYVKPLVLVVFLQLTFKR